MLETNRNSMVIHHATRYSSSDLEWRLEDDDGDVVVDGGRVPLRVGVDVTGDLGS